MAKVVPYEIPWNKGTAICIIIDNEPWFHIDSIETTILTRFDSLNQFIERVSNGLKIKLYASAFSSSNRAREWFISLLGITEAYRCTYLSQWRNRQLYDIETYNRLRNMFDTHLISNPPDPRSYVLNSVLDDFIATPDPNKRTSKPHCVYRLFNHKNTLLYVGISWSAAARLSQHYHTKLWFTEVVTITLEWFPTLREAKIAETQAIKTECPLYNIAEVCA